jgi:hypothetical protein
MFLYTVISCICYDIISISVLLNLFGSKALKGLSANLTFPNLATNYFDWIMLSNHYETLDKPFLTPESKTN